MTKRFEIIFTERPYVNSAELWQLANFAEYLKTYEGLDKVKVNFAKRASKIDNVLSTLRRSNMPHLFDIEHPTALPKEGISMSYLQLSDWNVSRLFISNFDNLIDNHQAWLSNILREPSFIHCRVFNTEYHRIQNLEKLQWYELDGIDYSHLPIINNGKKPPFNEDVIDISKNPGFSCFKPGYIEFVGNEMWLGKHFFERVKLNPNDVLNCSWLETQVLDNGVIYLKAYDKPFDSAEGEQADIQFNLRKLLFQHAPK